MAGCVTSRRITNIIRKYSSSLEAPLLQSTQHGTVTRSEGRGEGKRHAGGMWSAVFGSGLPQYVQDATFILRPPNDGLNQRGNQVELKNAPALSPVWLKAVLASVIFQFYIFIDPFIGIVKNTIRLFKWYLQFIAFCLQCFQVVKVDVAYRFHIHCRFIDRQR